MVFQARRSGVGVDDESRHDRESAFQCPSETVSRQRWKVEAEVVGRSNLEISCDKYLKTYFSHFARY